MMFIGQASQKYLKMTAVQSLLLRCYLHLWYTCSSSFASLLPPDLLPPQDVSAPGIAGVLLHAIVSGVLFGVVEAVWPTRCYKVGAGSAPGPPCHQVPGAWCSCAPPGVVCGPVTISTSTFFDGLLVTGLYTSTSVQASQSVGGSSAFGFGGTLVQTEHWRCKRSPCAPPAPALGMWFGASRGSVLASFRA
ncbi:hypothetical protein Anapl_17470 [Anas platyrhynchos]|uniref:Uncharacterized protein n=1 Tax=Anas platyrhynchos TaxID=8839 RepID=R0JBE1_ANAPL|nr:hypothetical protein Anapl_17470 [Anas platyrhynchos]